MDKIVKKQKKFSKGLTRFSLIYWLVAIVYIGYSYFSDNPSFYGNRTVEFGFFTVPASVVLSVGLFVGAIVVYLQWKKEQS